MTAKQRKHSELIDSAHKTYGNTMRFAVYCIAHNYEATTLKAIEKLLKELKHENI